MLEQELLEKENILNNQKEEKVKLDGNSKDLRKLIDKTFSEMSELVLMDEQIMQII